MSAARCISTSAVLQFSTLFFLEELLRARHVRVRPSKKEFIRETKKAKVGRLTLEQEKVYTENFWEKEAWGRVRMHVRQYIWGRLDSNVASTAGEREEARFRQG